MSDSEISLDDGSEQIIKTSGNKRIGALAQGVSPGFAVARKHIAPEGRKKVCGAAASSVAPYGARSAAGVVDPRQGLRAAHRRLTEKSHACRQV